VQVEQETEHHPPGRAGTRNRGEKGESESADEGKREGNKRIIYKEFSHLVQKCILDQLLETILKDGCISKSRYSYTKFRQKPFVPII
jgi:hypothetical protein